MAHLCYVCVFVCMRMYVSVCVYVGAHMSVSVCVVCASLYVCTQSMLRGIPIVDC